MPIEQLLAICLLILSAVLFYADRRLHRRAMKMGESTAVIVVQAACFGGGLLSVLGCVYRPQDVQALKAEGLGAAAIAKRLKIGRASVYRALQAGNA